MNLRSTLFGFLTKAEIKMHKIVTAFLLIMGFSTASAAPTTFEWDAVTDSRLISYTLKWQEVGERAKFVTINRTSTEFGPVELTPGDYTATIRSVGRETDGTRITSVWAQPITFTVTDSPEPEQAVFPAPGSACVR